MAKPTKEQKRKAKLKAKKATGDPQSAIADGTLICCIGETLQAGFAGIY